MSGNVAGGKKASETIKKKYGDNYYCTIGAIGGSKKGVKKGFATMTPEKRAEAGRKGGMVSRRTPKESTV